MPKSNATLNDAPEVEITVTQARDATEEELYELISTALDEAQAPVFQGEQPFNYLVIKIVPDK